VHRGAIAAGHQADARRSGRDAGHEPQRLDLRIEVGVGEEVRGMRREPARVEHGGDRARAAGAVDPPR